MTNISMPILQTINALGALRAHLSEDVKAGLNTEALRSVQGGLTHVAITKTGTDRSLGAIYK